MSVILQLSSVQIAVSIALETFDDSVLIPFGCGICDGCGGIFNERALTPENANKYCHRYCSNCKKS